jgi:hypothetical protein
MGAMKPEIVGPTEWWEVETNQGTYYVQCEFVGRENVKAVALLDYLPETTDTSDIMRWEFKSGYGARLSMPGYLDCTDWSVHDTEREAKDCLAEEHELCPLCLDDLDVESACATCIKDLPQEKFDEALRHVVTEQMTVAELMGLPGVYEILSEEFNNEALNCAYQEMLVEHDTKKEEPDDQQDI